MKGSKMSKTEYLIRAVRESEKMPGWQDTFSEMRKDISKEFSENRMENEKEALEMDDIFQL